MRSIADATETLENFMILFQNHFTTYKPMKNPAKCKICQIILGKYLSY